jgi:chromosome partitioning protein
MRVISVLSRKGGSGKSTLVAHWAAEAERQRGGRAVIFDCDPQASLVSWYRRRQAEVPLLVQSDARRLRADLDTCLEDGVGLVVIDTPPHVEAIAADVARVSDVVVIPTRAAVFDIEAIGATVEIAAQARAKTVIVINAAPPRGGAADAAQEVLRGYGYPVCPTPIVQRAILGQALIDGRVARELDPRGKAAREIAATWKWIRSFLDKAGG